MTDEEPTSTSAAPPPLQLSMRPPTVGQPQRRFKPGQIALLVVSMLVVALLIVIAVVFRFFSNPFLDYACSGPGQRALAGREAFVKAHLSDASRFEIVTYDCEDGGSARLAFQTNLKPNAAREALLTDPTCGPYRTATDDDSHVLCGTGSTAGIVFLDTGSDRTTSGELHLES